MKTIIKICFLCFLTFCFNSYHSQYLISANYVNSISNVLLANFTSLTLDYEVDMYKMVYNTVDAQGQPTIASGAFLVPKNANCNDFPMAVYAHGTSLRKTDVPSNDIQETLIGKVFSSGGYFTCMPDYIGMGDSPGLHPYVHAESEATASLDMIRAAREFIANDLMMVDNGEVFLTGYSQGGHACMATHKYIQDNNLQAEFNVIASAPCSGPYALSVTMADSIMSPFPYSNPGYVTYLLASYQSVYGNIFNNWSDILKSPFDTLVPPFFNGTNTTLGMGQLNGFLPGVMDSLIVDSVLTHFINDSVNKTHPLWQALLDNDNFDWLPNEPVRMYYCTADEQVAYTNALVADSIMDNNGALDVQAINSGSGLSHNACVIPALSSAFDWFQSLKTVCSPSFISMKSNKAITIYPNPSFNELNINSSGGILKIFTIDGRIVHQENVGSKYLISTRSWDKGIYIIDIELEKGAKSQEYFTKI